MTATLPVSAGSTSNPSSSKIPANGASSSSRSTTPQPLARQPGSYYQRSDDEAVETVMTWSEIQHTVAQGDLADLNRSDRCEAEYRAWAVPVRAQWGGLEAYIRDVRLQWRAPTDNSSGTQAAAAIEGKASVRADETWPELEMLHPDGSGTVLKHFVDDPRLEEPDEGAEGEAAVKCIPNDWPYGVPREVGHWVVWSKLPILHPSLFSHPSTPFPPAHSSLLYSSILNDGVRGYTGTVSRDSDATSPSGTASPPPALYGNLSSTSTSLHLRSSCEPRLGPGVPTGGDGGLKLQETEAGQTWAGREVRSYVERRWSPERYETVWFCNPPHLRTVPGLSHFQMECHGLAAQA